MKNQYHILKEILPEAVMERDYNGIPTGKYIYKDYKICIHCGFIIRVKNGGCVGLPMRFKKYDDSFKNLLLSIK